jgi:hypothetical protein
VYSGKGKERLSDYGRPVGHNNKIKCQAIYLADQALFLNQN